LNKKKSYKKWSFSLFILDTIHEGIARDSGSSKKEGLLLDRKSLSFIGNVLDLGS
jgi:hypothetical protein